MSVTRILGLVLLAAGIVMLILGASSSDSFADQLSRTFTGRFTEETNFYIIGGVVGTVVGAAMTLFGGRRTAEL